MPDIGVVFTPIVWAMDAVLRVFVQLTGSVGLSILLLSATFSLLLLPLQKMGMKAERKVRARKQLVDVEVRAARRSGLKGEALFNETERIYKQHGYHPIQELLTAASFLAMLPVLISSIILFLDSPLLVGRSFLFVEDLSQPDAALGSGINVLPMVMFAFGVGDAFLRYRGDRAARIRFLCVSAVLLALVYSMPAGLVLYWIGSNITSSIVARVGTRPALQP